MINNNRPPSFQQIDYRIRPNKSTERRMFIEAFRRLSLFESIHNYRYIGFGSTTFTDFIMLHKALDIQDMISIENKKEYEARFEFNNPFDCIKIKYGDSNEVLPHLKWNKPTIAWLDYDGKLTDSVLRDISFFSTKAQSGSMLIISVNAEGYRYRNQEYKKVEAEYKKKFRQQLGLEIIPEDLKGKHFEGEEMAKTYRRFITSHIKDALRSRNGLASSRENTMMYRSLINLVYKDGARMLTVGVVFYEQSDQEKLVKCGFEQLPFVTAENDELYEIKVPVMTPRERRYLDQRLPNGNYNEALEKIGLTEEEISNYCRLYRFCSSFAEVEVL